MAVTDLTNTMWIINETPSYSPFTGIETLLGITFTSNNQTFTYIDFVDYHFSGVLQLSYESTGVYSINEFDGWANTAYRTITITGGNDVTNATLIAWLQANAVQQELYSKEYKYYPKADLTAIADAIRSVKGTSTTYTIDQMIETLAGGGKVTDLTGTTWYFNEVPDLSTLPYDSYRLQYESGAILTITHSTISIKYGPETFINYNIESGWSSDSARSVGPISSGGYDETNQDLIDWLYENATLQS